ncbi:MAG: DUF935 domain-containing protein [Gammaproteobacteria bacterium]|nr:DUF935 domain-containing protein [Gammaproteobacteria bacterium]
MQLYDQFGRPIKAQKTPPIDTEILAYAPLTMTSRDYVSHGLTPERLAGIFREADAGDMARQADLFDQLEEKDGHLVGEKGKRMNVILDVEFNIEPASEDSRDIRVAEFVEKWMDDLTDWEDTLVSLQDAVGKGYAALEINWDISSGQAVPSGFEFIEQKRFLFTDEAGYLTHIPRLITDDALMGMTIPEWKTLFHQYGGKSGHPTRSGLFRVATWMYLFKNYAIKDWVIFSEICGIPVRVGKYAPGASKEDKHALMQALRNIGSDAAGIISQNTEIDFVENSGTGVRSDMFEKLAGFCNKEISKAILGQTLTADVGNTGSYAASKTHNDVRIDLLKADARAVATTIRHDVLRPIVGFNFGWDTPCPKYTPDFAEEEDLKAKSEWMEKAVARVAVPVPWYREQFGIPEPKDGEETVGGPADTTPPPVEAKHRQVVAKEGQSDEDSTPADTIQAIKDKALNTEDLAATLQPFVDLLNQVETLEEYKAEIEKLQGSMDAEAFGEHLAQAMMVAELAGRYDA